jgi:hypothetical protein
MRSGVELRLTLEERDLQAAKPTEMLQFCKKIKEKNKTERTKNKEKTTTQGKY